MPTVATRSRVSPTSSASWRGCARSASTAAASRLEARRAHARVRVGAGHRHPGQGDDLVIRVELAGVDPEDVDLRFSHGVLTVSGTRRPEPADDGAEFLIRERFYGEFRRVITLPDGTDADQIPAEFDDGLVEITVSNGVTPADSTKIALADKSEAPTTRSVLRD